MKADFCRRVEIAETSIDLKQFLDLPLRVQSADNYFNNSNFNGYVFPIVVTMTLPELIIHNLEGSDDSDESNDNSNDN